MPKSASIIFLLFLALSALAQDGWQKNYRAGGKIYGAHQNSDSGLILAGSTPDGKMPLLIRVNASGDTVWHRIIHTGSFYNGMFSDAVELSSGNYLALGWEYKTSTGRILLTNWSSNGDLNWIKAFNYGSSYITSDKFQWIRSDTVALTICSPFHYILLDTSGNILSSVKIPGVSDGVAHWSEQDHSLLIQSSVSFPSGGIAYGLCKADPDTGIIWSKSWTFEEEYVSIGQGCVTSDTGFAFTYGYDIGPSYYLKLIKISNSGNVQFSEQFLAGYQCSYTGNTIPTMDGGLLVSGTTAISHDSNYFWLSKMNTIGTIQWSVTFGNSMIRDGFAFAVQGTDSSYFVAGTEAYYSDDAFFKRTASLIHMNQSGSNLCNPIDNPIITLSTSDPINTLIYGGLPLTFNTIHEIAVIDTVTCESATIANICWPESVSILEPHIQVTCFPNPAVTQLSFTYTLPAATLVALTINDATGRLVASVLNEKQSLGPHQCNTNVSNLSSGLYYYEMRTGQGRSSGKIIIR